MAHDPSSTYELMTIEDVARRWKASKRSIERLVKNGQLRAIKIGRLIRFDPDDVAALERR